MNQTPEYLVILSEEDPCARAVAEAWGSPASSGYFVDGTPLRVVDPRVWMLRRPGLHVHDSGLDAQLPPTLTSPAIPLVFASIHWSEAGPRCFTVHPLGNFGPGTELGGVPGSLVPAAPAWMSGALTRLAESGARIGLPASYEATHHGPSLARPAFFLEVGGGPTPAGPSAEELEVYARVLRSLRPTEGDRTALAAGGGHYAPHFTDLALRRRWSFGHIVPRHFVEQVDREMVEAAVAATPGCEGVVFARARDALLPSWQAGPPRLRDQDAPRRGA